MELIVQFAFLNLFSLAFPLCYLLAFANNILEIQVDKYKLVKITRRPIPVFFLLILTYLKIKLKFLYIKFNLK